MGDPVTMAVVGGTIGAATNRKDPLKGALMGAAGGYAGGAMMGAGAGTAAGTGGGFAGGGYGSIGTTGAGSGGMFSGMSNMFSVPSSIKGLGQDISAANTWMNQNPTTSQIGFKLAQEMLQAPEQVPMPGGTPVQRGQIQPMDYMSLLAPQQSQVLRPATPSLI